MEAEDEDSQGKNKESTLKARSAVLWTIFFVAACAGFVAAQVLYIYLHQNPSILKSSGSSSSIFATDHGWPRNLLGSSQATDPEAIPPWKGAPRNELEKILQIVAPSEDDKPREVMIAICTYNLVEEGLFSMFLDTLIQSGVKNYLIVGLDKHIRNHLLSKGINVYYHQVASVDQMDNHAISGKKFRIIQSILELGWSVLLSDIDVVVLQNPFNHLYRDSDVEAMSDGFDTGSAYGTVMPFDDPEMGWARYAQGTQHMNLNSGLFYVRANKRAIELMSRTAIALEINPSLWDQAELNHQLFSLTHGSYTSTGCTVRVMEIEKFMNSKVLFKYFRKRPYSQITGNRKPVMLHMNYHPDKQERMRGAIQFFLQGNADALQPFPGGSEPHT